MRRLPPLLARFSTLLFPVGLLPVAALTVVLALLSPAGASAQAPAHPLDGLSLAEYWTLYETLRDSGELSEGSRFLYAGLNEPPKAEVLAWTPGQSFRREARVHLVQDDAGYEAVVDLQGSRVLEFEKVTDTQYMAYDGEWSDAVAALMEHPDWVAGFEARGITDLDMIACFPISDAYFDEPEQRGRRIARITCWNRIGSLSGWGTPISSLIGVVDLESGEVLRVIDLGPTPPAPLMGEHHAEAVGPTRDELPPLGYSQPVGPGFQLDGHEVSWEGWRFQFRVDQRRGIVLSRVRHVDGDRERSVLYQASLSELFVPYQDPAEPWNHQAYYDLGTYPSQFGGIASTLEPGRDCPPHAKYFDTYVITQDGSPTQRARVACMYERPGAEPAWRHTRGDVVESRARRDLVLRMVMGAGNYDYLFDWVFKQDGSIRVNLAATGIDQVKSVAHESAAVDDDAAPDDRYGRFVAPYLVAVNHSHIFSFRIDFDVDGQENSLVVDRLVTETLEDNPRRSVWRVDPLVAQREADAMRTSTLTKPEIWRVVNPSEIGPQGYPSGYLLEGHGAKTLLLPDDYLQGRAGFTNHTLWVTPMSADELYAAGDYPTSSVAGQGLPEWTSANRPIENTDIVVWYTIGFHHVARPEDWPILPLELHGFYLKPAAFFTRNPAIDLPK
jgi:primary-amine oxidase